MRTPGCSPGFSLCTIHMYQPVRREPCRYWYQMSTA
nr:MAG TPA: hypothetical protein [Caudoviricetes sp.]